MESHILLLKLMNSLRRVLGEDVQFLVALQWSTL